MKKTLAILLFAVTVVSAMAQIPQKFTYQAVVRDTNGNHFTNRSVRARINILKGSPTGTAIYRESILKRVDRNGLLTVEVGTGTPDFGDFDTIDWLDGDHFLKCEYDPNCGTNYSLVITQQIMSVPYALISDTALSVAVTDSMTARYDRELARLDSIIAAQRQHLSDLYDSINALPQNAPRRQLSELDGLLRKNAEILRQIEQIRNSHADDRNRAAVRNNGIRISSGHHHNR